MSVFLCCCCSCCSSVGLFVLSLTCILACLLACFFFSISSSSCSNTHALSLNRRKRGKVGTIRALRTFINVILLFSSAVTAAPVQCVFGLSAPPVSTRRVSLVRPFWTLLRSILPFFFWSFPWLLQNSAALTRKLFFRRNVNLARSEEREERKTSARFTCSALYKYKYTYIYIYMYLFSCLLY